MDNMLNFLIAACVSLDNNKAESEIDTNIKRLKSLKTLSDCNIYQKEACERGIRILEKEKLNYGTK